MLAFSNSWAVRSGTILKDSKSYKTASIGAIYTHVSLDSVVSMTWIPFEIWILIAMLYN